jgi:hypothetical protein
VECAEQPVRASWMGETPKPAKAERASLVAQGRRIETEAASIRDKGLPLRLRWQHVGCSC